MKRYSICTNCLYQSDKKIHICPQCSCEQIVYFNHKEVVFLGRKYTLREWYYLNASFKVLSNDRIVTRSIHLPQNPVFIKFMYQENIHRYTKRGIHYVYLFFIFFSIIAAGLVFFLDTKDYIAQNTFIISLFFSLFLFLSGASLWVYSCFKKPQVVLVINRNRQIQYKFIDKHKADTNLRILDHHIEQKILQNTFFPKLIGDRVDIRLFNRRDIKAYFQFMSNADVAKYMSWTPYQSIEQAKKALANIFLEYQKDELFHLAITLKDNTMIGYIGLSRYDLTESTCQVVYAIDKPYWRKGYVTEALNLFVAYLFEKKNMQLIIATHIKENEVSGKVMEKCGFKRTPERDTVMVIKQKEEQLLAYTIERRKDI